MRSAVALAAVCALGLAACAGSPGPASAGATAPPPPLEGTRWVAVAEADPRALPRLEFAAGGRLTGYTGCNMMSGTWRMEGGVARLDRVITTKRMCAGPGGDLERRILACLGEGGRIAREGDRLVLRGPGGVRVEFAPATAA